MIYEAGYITIASGSDQVEGEGTYFLSYIKKGDSLTLEGVIYYVIAIADNHQLQLHTNYLGADIIQGSYQIDSAEMPGLFYVFNAPTLTWVASTPTPSVQSLVITLGLKNIQLAWSVVDTAYPSISYQTEIWHNTVDNFATATLLSTLSGNVVKYSDLPITAHYYWLRAVNTDYAITGASTASGVQVPVAVATQDIATNAVTHTASAVTVLSSITKPIAYVGYNATVALNAPLALNTGEVSPAIAFVTIANMENFDTTCGRLQIVLSRVSDNKDRAWEFTTSTIPPANIGNVGKDWFIPSTGTAPIGYIKEFPYTCLATSASTYAWLPLTPVDLGVIAFDVSTRLVDGVAISSGSFMFKFNTIATTDSYMVNINMVNESTPYTANIWNTDIGYTEVGLTIFTGKR